MHRHRGSRHRAAADLHRRRGDIALYAIYPPTRHLSSKVRLFIDFLVERFGERNWAAEHRS